MSKIFVSYRRSDSNPDATNIYNRLVQSYKRQRIEVSNDLGYIPAGVNAQAYAADRLKGYRALVIIMGPSWLKSANREGTRRLDIATDLVRIEVAAALHLSIPIVVVLVRQASMPEPNELPSAISGLAAGNTDGIIQFRGEPEFNSDMRRLYKALEPKLSVQDHSVTPLVVDDSVVPGRVHDLKEFRNTGHPPQRNFRLRSLGELNHVLHGRTGQLGQAADLREVDLSYTNLTGADLSHIDLRGANLAGTNLTGANLAGADLRETRLQGTQLSGASLREAQLGGLDLTDVKIDTKTIAPKQRLKVDLSDAHLEEAQLQRMDLKEVILAGAFLAGADLSGADLRGVDLTGATLDRAVLDHADLTRATLTKAVLRSAHLIGTNVSGAALDGAILDGVSVIQNLILDARTDLGSVAWNGVPVIQLNKDKTSTDALMADRDAARIYHQIADALRKRGLPREASNYRLREQQVQRRILLRQLKLGQWFFSKLLDMMAGYGERPGRALLTYVLVIVGFAAVYFGATNYFLAQNGTLAWYDALILSVTSFHGRGLVPSSANLADPLSGFAAAEAVLGFLIELIFIATFSRRFLGGD